VKDPACRVAPERGGPSRKRRPSPSSGTATETPARPRRPKNQSNIIERISPRSGRTETAPLHKTTPAGRPARGPVGQRASGQERGKSACGSAHRLRTLRSAQHGKECDLRKSRSFSERSRSSPEGPRLQAWCAQRIERVARRAAHRRLAKSDSSRSAIIADRQKMGCKRMATTLFKYQQLRTALWEDGRSPSQYPQVDLRHAA
jgi:hypothetical protein